MYSLLNNPQVVSMIGAFFAVVLIFLAKTTLKKRANTGQPFILGKAVLSNFHIKAILKFLDFTVLSIAVFGIIIPLITGCSIMADNINAIGFTFIDPDYCFRTGIIPRPYANSVFVILLIPIIIFAIVAMKQIKKWQNKV